ncbi:hypothetical protein [Flagellimonas sp. GZD32]
MFCKQKSAFGHLKVDERRKTVSLERILSYLEAKFNLTQNNAPFT